MTEMSMKKTPESAFSNTNLLAVEKLCDITLEQAIRVFSSAISGTMGTVLKKEKSPMYDEITLMKKHPEKCENISVRLGHSERGDSISHNSTEVYSIKLEIDKKERTLTLAVGENFTELSMMKGKALSELAVQEKGEILYEKYSG